MKLYRIIALALTFALLITPSLAEFKGKQGEKATYESLINGAAQGTAVYSTEGKFRIGNTETRNFRYQTQREAGLKDIWTTTENP